MNNFKFLGISLVIVLGSVLPAHAQKILNGVYINGPQCGYDCCFTVEVKNRLYRSQDTCNIPNVTSFSNWKSIGELSHVAKGVIRSSLKNSPQLCLQSLIVKTKSSRTKTGYLDNEHSLCTTKGWVYKDRMAQ
jgi:hypothetical protein